MPVAPRNPASILICLVAILSLGCNDASGPSTGSIEVTILTTGGNEDRDRDGYVLIVDDKPGSTVNEIDFVMIADVAFGTHLVKLDGLQANCIVSGTNPRSVEVTAGGKDASPVVVAFVVLCAPNQGTIQVSTATTGSDPDPDGYIVVVGTQGRGRASANGTFSVTGVREGPWGVSIGDVAVNCTVDPPQVKTVNVVFGATVQVSFSVRCTPTVSLRLTVSTTGVDLDSNGYTVHAQHTGTGAVVAANLPANGTAAITGLVPGNYLLSLFDVAPNCDAVVPTPRTVTVTENPNAVTFEVTCELGRQLAFVGGTGNSFDIYVINSSDAGMMPITTLPQTDDDPAWSPDGSKIAFSSNRDGNFDIYVIALAGAGIVRLTPLSTTADYRPAWSPNGDKIAFVSRRDGNDQIYVMSADGSNQVRVTTSTSHDSEPAWSPDGTKIAFSSDREGTSGIWVMNADGSAPTRLTTNTRGDWQPAWSPDGTRIAFSRGASTNFREIFIMNANGTGAVSLTQGFVSAQDPSWSLDGRKIAFSSPSCADSYYYYYYGCDSRIMVVGIDGTVFAPLTTPFSAFNPTWRP